MAIDYTVDALVRSLKIKGSIPTKQNLFSLDDFYILLTEEMIVELVPLIMSVKEDYFISQRDVTIIDERDVLGFGEDNFGQFPFGSPIPEKTSDIMHRAIGGKIKDIHLLDANGRVAGDVARITYDDLSSRVGVSGFFFRGGDIVFYPAESFVGRNVRFYFYRRPNSLVSKSKCGSVIYSNTTDNTVEVQSLGSDFVVGMKVDIVRGVPGFDSVVDDALITDITGNVIELDKSPVQVIRGDWVCPAGCAPVAQIPYEAHPLLSQLGNIKALEANGDLNQIRVAQEKYDRQVPRLMKTITPRADNALKIAVSRNGIWARR